jgi:hypothetical protein
VECLQDVVEGADGLAAVLVHEDDRPRPTSRRMLAAMPA